MRIGVYRLLLTELFLYMKFASSQLHKNNDFFIICNSCLLSVVSVAQWIARWTSNPEVPGSSPGGDGFLNNATVDMISGD